MIGLPTEIASPWGKCGLLSKFALGAIRFLDRTLSILSTRSHLFPTIIEIVNSYLLLNGYTFQDFAEGKIM
jgi:hypothetical protein